MKRDRIIELLECERQCILRNDGNSCNRDCANCDLVQDSKELLAMYDIVKKVVVSYEQRVIGRWKQLKGNFTTPGGTPYYVCGACGGSGHLNGCEYPRRKVICDTCGRINLYPWERAYEEGSSLWEDDEEEVKQDGSIV
ncbi:MAG: hypothetical protein IKO00_02210 [Oscillospiraceae bacterium]|nr:hypothetical protein [Oscillospiraceae bacterium]